MNKLLLGALLGLMTFSTFSAELMSKVEFEKVKKDYVEVGKISVSGKVAQSDAKKELSKKADEKGGDIYVLTSANTSNKISGTAIVYKKKM